MPRCDFSFDDIFYDNIFYSRDTLQIRTRPPSARKELMASILRDDVAYKPTKKLAKPDNVVIKAAFPDLGGSTDSILRAKRRSAPFQRSKSASFARNEARGA